MSGNRPVGLKQSLSMRDILWFIMTTGSQLSRHNYVSLSSGALRTLKHMSQLIIHMLLITVQRDVFAFIVD